MPENKGALGSGIWISLLHLMELSRLAVSVQVWDQSASRPLLLPRHRPRHRPQNAVSIDFQTELLTSKNGVSHGVVDFHLKGWDLKAQGSEQSYSNLFKRCFPCHGSTKRPLCTIQPNWTPQCSFEGTSTCGYSARCRVGSLHNRVTEDAIPKRRLHCTGSLHHHHIYGRTVS
jgi:hypothetical protein